MTANIEDDLVGTRRTLSSLYTLAGLDCNTGRWISPRIDFIGGC